MAAILSKALEGILHGDLWYHYDLDNDVLYLRMEKHRRSPVFGEDQPDGTILFRLEKNEKPVGMTVVSWWKLFGTGGEPDSLKQIFDLLESWCESHKLAA